MPPDDSGLRPARGGGSVAGVLIRDALPEDWAAIWPFFQSIVAAGETYAYDRDMDAVTGEAVWMMHPPGRTVVAVDEAGVVLGTANLHPNHGGPGAHVANASFMVDPTYGGHGVGRALAEHVLDRARADGYRSMQFNAVVETNGGALSLWRSLGFDTLATIPEAFDHPRYGLVGLKLMYRRL